MSGLCSKLVDRATRMPHGPAARTHRHGIWNPTTWAQLHDEASEVGMGLRSRGVEAGEVVAIVAANQVALVATELGAQGIGARTLLVDPATDDEVVFELLARHRVVAVIAGDEEQHDKVVASASSLPSVRAIAVIETRGLRHLDDDGASSDALVLSYRRLATLGRANASEWSAMATSRAATEAAAIFGDSVVDHGSLVQAGETLCGARSLSEADSTYALVSFAEPSSHTVLSAALVAGFPVHFGSSEDQRLADLRAVRPTILHASGNVLNAIKADADGRARITKGFKRASYDAGIARGTRSVRLRANDRPLMLILGVVLAFALLVFSGLVVDKSPLIRVIAPLLVAAALVVVAARLGFLTGRPVRNRYGVGRLRALLHTDGAMSQETSTWFRGLGVPITAAEMDSFGFLTGSGQ